MRVIAQQGDTVDVLCWRHHGSTAAVEHVLEANPGLSARGPVLPMGTEVELPDTAPATTNDKIIQLWE